MRRLRWQLLGILLGTALLPSIPAAWIAHSLFQMSLDPMRESTLLEGSRAGLASTRDLLEAYKRTFVDALDAAAPVDTLTATALAALDPRERSALRAWRSAAPDGAAGPAIHLEPRRLPIGGRDVLVARVVDPRGNGAWVTRAIPDSLTRRAEQLTSNVRLLGSLRRQSRSVAGSLILTFAVTYGAILLLVAGTGFFLASRISAPLERLAGGIHSVAGGDLTTRVDGAPGHIGRLVDDFNEMVEQLESQRHELARLERLAAWRDMARRLAHEIKNPLTPIQLAAQELRDQVPASDAAYHQLVVEGTSIIEEEVASLRELVADFSTFSKTAVPDRADVPLGQLIGRLTELYGERLRWTPRNGAGSQVVHCDRDQLHRALINLVNNGLEAQQEIGVDEAVQIDAARSAAGDWLLTVADRGPGIPPALRERVLQPDVTTKSNGMGLGLAIVDGTVRAHGGTLSIDERHGGGTCFTIRLPAAPDPLSEQRET